MVMAIGWIAPTRASTRVDTVVRRPARMSSLRPGSNAAIPPKSAASAVWMSDTIMPTMIRMPSVRHQLSRTRFQLRPSAFTGPMPSAKSAGIATDQRIRTQITTGMVTMAIAPMPTQTPRITTPHAEGNQQGGNRKTEQVEGRAGVLRLPGLDPRQLVRVVDVLQDVLQEGEWVGPIGAGDQAEDQVGEDDDQGHARDHREVATIQLEGLVEEFA